VTNGKESVSGNMRIIYAVFEDIPVLMKVGHACPSLSCTEKLR